MVSETANRRIVPTDKKYDMDPIKVLVMGAPGVVKSTLIHAASDYIEMGEKQKLLFTEADTILPAKNSCSIVIPENIGVENPADVIWFCTDCNNMKAWKQLQPRYVINLKRSSGFPCVRISLNIDLHT